MVLFASFFLNNFTDYWTLLNYADTLNSKIINVTSVCIGIDDWATKLNRWQFAFYNHFKKCSWFNIWSDTEMCDTVDLSSHFNWRWISYSHCKCSEKMVLKMGNELKEKNGNNPSVNIVFCLIQDNI